METIKNTVTIDVKDYNALRDFQKTIQEDGIVVKPYGHTQYFTREGFLKASVIELKEQAEEIEKLKDKIYNLKQELKKQNRWWPFR